MLILKIYPFWHSIWFKLENSGVCIKYKLDLLIVASYLLVSFFFLPSSLIHCVSFYMISSNLSSNLIIHFLQLGLIYCVTSVINFKNSVSVNINSKIYSCFFKRSAHFFHYVFFLLFGFPYCLCWVIYFRYIHLKFLSHSSITSVSRGMS